MVDSHTEPRSLALVTRNELTLHQVAGDQRPLGSVSATISAEFRLLLSGIELLLLEVARRLESATSNHFPGIVDVVETTVIYAGEAKRNVYGWYRPNAWHDTRSGQHFAEIVLNAALLHEGSDEVMDTMVHELVHAYARAMDLRDTSRTGHYHNGVFADLALKAGLIVDRHKTRGHATVGISTLGRAMYGDLLEPLERLLRLHRTSGPDRPDPGGASGQPGPAGPSDEEEPTPAKYVMANCACTNDRGRPIVIRVARGNWTANTIWCKRCQCSFTDPGAPLSESPQDRAAAA
jgi:hypothetical protein